MDIIIIGAGRVGLRTARVLHEEGHEITIIETDYENTTQIQETGFEVIRGDGAREPVLMDAGIESADAIGALCGDLNANFAACSIAKHYHTWTVLRVDEDYREEVYQTYAKEVDKVIYPERLGAIGAKNALLGGSVRAIADIAQRLQVVLMTITTNSPMRGYTIEEVALPAQTRVLAFGKADEQMRLPLSDDSLEVGDRLAVLADFEVLEEVRQLIVGQRLAP
ncbi:TrkA family potassium uptake protein [Haloquadratum walsbyi]|jgi:K+ transport systems, NAD-binding component|uniref:K+ transport system, NAD-binding component n=1 Tax=Haloquadratum walsbyi J07HQW2 TaxID=1238425 RepID=U1MY77_9EURY|nr:TrkA family potassium uptake protein [Haloquadratum walsbyi]ERG95434.1 MAG: K+ transport system, NAD-binding component [Haloquadratum walsbyi J07HQW2]